VRPIIHMKFQHARNMMTTVIVELVYPPYGIYGFQPRWSFTRLLGRVCVTRDLPKGQNEKVCDGREVTLDGGRYLASAAGQATATSTANCLSQLPQMH